MRGWGQAIAVGLVVLAAGAGCNETGLKRTQGSLATSPVGLDYGPTAIGSGRTLELWVSNTGRAPFRVEEAAATVPNVTVEAFEPFELPPSESRLFKVTFLPVVEGRVTGAVVVRNDAGGESQIDLSGLGVRALVELDTRLVEFGDVELLDSRLATVKVSNPTSVDSPFSLSIEGDDADEFTSSLLGEQMLAPGEIREVPIAFRPIRIGVATAELKAVVCAGCEPTVVRLFGMGISRIVAVYPERLNFGRVPIGATVEQRLTVTNNGTQPLAFNPPSIQGDGTGVFEVTGLPNLPGGQILSGASAEITVSFTPKVIGRVAGPVLAVPVTASNAQTGPKIPLLGEGGNACVALVPERVDFGVVPVGMSVVRRVDLINRCTGAVTLSHFDFGQVVGGFFDLDQPDQTFQVAVGGIQPIRIRFQPKPGSSRSTASLAFQVQEGATLSTQTVPITGDTRDFPVCSYSVQPLALQFGLVALGAEVSLGASIRNIGTTECFVSGFGPVVGSDPEFVSEEVASATLQPGEQTTVRVRFRPTAEAPFSGLLQAWVNQPGNPHVTVPLSGSGVKGCFALQPTTVDFGSSKLSCGVRQRGIVGVNTCMAPITVTSAALGQLSSAEFTLVAAPALPAVLQPGGQLPFAVQYAPQDDGVDYGALMVDSGQGGMHVAGLIGGGVNRTSQSDLFAQERAGQVDVLFVIDNSGSMMEEQQAIGINFAAFLSAAQGQNVDYQIGVTTTGIEGSPGGWAICPGGVEGGEAGRLFPVDNSSPRVITPYTPNASQVFASNTAVGWCHWNEQGLEAAYRALSSPLMNSADDPRTSLQNDGNEGFLRPDAKLVIIFVTDEEDFSPQPVAFYETFLRSLKNNDLSKLSVSAVIGPLTLSSCPTASSSGARYVSLVNALGGVVESICTPDWSTTLQNLSTNAFMPKRQFALKATPDDPLLITVNVNGMPVAGGWSYDPGSNSVVFDLGAVPAAGAIVEINYPLGC